MAGRLGCMRAGCNNWAKRWIGWNASNGALVKAALCADCTRIAKTPDTTPRVIDLGAVKKVEAKLC